MEVAGGINILIKRQEEKSTHNSIIKVSISTIDIFLSQYMVAIIAEQSESSYSFPRAQELIHMEQLGVQ